MDGSDARRDRAAELLVGMLVRNPHPGDAELEALCLAHPSLAAELRRLCAVWRAAAANPRDADRLLAAAADLGSEVSLLEGPDARPTGTRDLIERLYRHRPGEPRYRDGEFVNKGGMGEILRVWDSDLRRPLAKKSMLKSADDPDFPNYLRRFLDEAQITGQLHHPSIVPVYELGVDGKGELYFTMPLIRGSSFDRVIEALHKGEEGWTLTRALHVVIKVCEALAFAHSHGVVHRDVKPANIMVGRFGETYVMDWGLARILGEADRRDLRLASSVVATDGLDERIANPASPLITMDGQVVGTPYYMPPEQASGRIEEVGPRSDVYAVGTVLYQLLTNRPPYHTPGDRVSPHAVLARVQSGPPASIASINPAAARELVEICDGAMARRIRDRYADASELARDLERYLDNRLPVASERSVARLTRLAIRRHRGIAITVGTAALLISLLLVGFILRLQGEAEQRGRMLDFMASAALQDVSDVYPIRPDRIPAMSVWLERVEDLLGRAARYEREQERGAATPPPTGDERATMLQNFAELRALADRVGAHRQIAEDLRARATRPETMQAWQEARRSLASDQRFIGFALEPDPGLLPLRQDPVSRLWEFWVVASGERPGFEPQEPGYAIGPETGIVLVLLPGGTFTLGSPATERNRSPDDEASCPWTLPPYFIAKYETTQGQWLRVMGDNPSDPEAVKGLAEEVVLVHPVEQVHWGEAREFARRLGARLPSEPEWEYACRAGTSSAFYWGDEGDQMHREQDGTTMLFENVADISAYGAKDGHPASGPHAPWKDGYDYHAPVGAFAANAFGLHDMAGNVSEWCGEDYYQKRYDDEQTRNHDYRPLRGGTFLAMPDLCRSAQRQWQTPRVTSFLVGVRIALDALR